MTKQQIYEEVWGEEYFYDDSNIMATVSYTHLDVYKRQVPEEHKSGIDMSRDLLRRSHVLVVCGHSMTESMKNDIVVAQRLGITATTLEGILTVKGQGRR